MVLGGLNVYVYVYEYSQIILWKKMQYVYVYFEALNVWEGGSCSSDWDCYEYDYE